MLLLKLLLVSVTRAPGLTAYTTPPDEAATLFVIVLLPLIVSCAVWPM